MSFNILVIYGSVRSGRQGIKAARYIVNKLKERGHTVTLIDPLEYKLPLLDKMYKEFEKGQAPAPMEKLAGLIRSADAFVVVSGEYNHSIPPALTNLMDHFLEEYFFRPSAIVTYSAGGFGGARAAIQCRALLGEIGAPSIPSIFSVPRVQDSFKEDGTPTQENSDKFVGKFLDELEWYAEALKAQREKSGTPY